MKSPLHELALKVGFEVVTAEEDYTDYEYTETISGVESISYLVRVFDNQPEKDALTFEGIINVLPKKLKKHIFKLVKGTNKKLDEKAYELAIFAIDEYRSKCVYTKLSEYGALLNVDIAALGYEFSYNMSKKDAKACLAKIERALPMEYAPVLGKIKKLEYKIGYVKNNKITAKV